MLSITCGDQSRKFGHNFLTVPSRLDS
jgi:hypothetical protein